MATLYAGLEGGVRIVVLPTRGETYDREDGPGIAYRFPDTDTEDGVYYFPDNNSFDVITEGRFFTARSLHQHADSWIDDDDRLHIDTDETRMIVDPR